jgi:hypothetical protein
MKSTFVARLTLSTIALVAGITPLAAETHSVLRVSVPFSFTAAGTQMPAGDYSIEQTGEAGTMILHSLSGKKSIMVLTGPMGTNPSAHGPSLTFNRASGEAVLTSITTDSSTVRSLGK